MPARQREHQTLVHHVSTPCVGARVTWEGILLKPEGNRRGIRWFRDGSDAMFGLYVGRHSTYRLVVERATIAWEWVVWPVGDPSRRQFGETHTAIRAALEANAAVRSIDGKISPR